MTDDDDDEDGDGEEEDAIFTVVDADEARQTIESRERRRRCRETTDPAKEEVNAKLGMSFVCRVCGHVHYPDKKPEPVHLNAKNKKVYPRKPIPDACKDMIPKAPNMRWLDNDRLTISAGKDIELPTEASKFKHGPLTNDDQCQALANLDGYVSRMRENFVHVRKAVIDHLIKTPFTDAPKATRIKRTTEAASGCDRAPSGVESVFLGDENIADQVIEWMFPITTILTLGAQNPKMLDVTEDLKMLLLHVDASMDIDNGRKNEQYVYVQTREQLNNNPETKILHEHYLCINTNPINRDCEIYEVPITAVAIPQALKLVEAGKARRVR